MKDILLIQAVKLHYLEMWTFVNREVPEDYYTQPK